MYMYMYIVHVYGTLKKKKRFLSIVYDYVMLENV